MRVLAERSMLSDQHLLVQREAALDRIEVGGVRGRPDHLGARSLDGVLDSYIFVNTGVVEHDDAAWLAEGAQAESE